MITLVVEKEKVEENSIFIDELSDINHIKNVFRKNVGDTIRVVDGESEYFCAIEKVESKKMILKILSKKSDKILNSVQIDAALCLLKNDKMDMVIQKLTELGIANIIPVIAKRNVVKLEKKKDKWDIIVRETLKQCQGINPTNIKEIVKLQKIDFSFYDLIIVPYECEKELYLKELFKNLQTKPRKILYIIGAEGGFDKEEVDFLKNNGANIISLGRRILRAETAAIVTGGILINEFQ